MQKYLITTAFGIVLNLSCAFGSQINGNILNQTNETIYFCQLHVAAGNWYGPKEGSAVEPVPPSTPAGYSQTSSGGSIETYFTLQQTPCSDKNSPSKCTFRMGYNSGSGYNHSPTSATQNGAYTCEVDDDSCSSCLTFKVSSNQSKLK